MPSNTTPDFGRVTVNPKWKIAIVRSMWHSELTSVMVSSAVETLTELGVDRKNISLIDVPGSFELPLFCQKALQTVDGAIAFGVVVQGETHHAKMIADQAVSGLMRVQLDLKKPITFEVLFVDRIVDAEKRTTGEKSVGPIAARTLLTSLAKLGEIH